MLLRIAAFISAFVLVAFVVVLMNQTLQLVQVASEASPILGKLVFYGLLALYTTLLLVPLILYLRLPKQLTPPTSIESSGFPRYLAALRKRLSKNSRLREHPLTTQQHIEAAIAVLDKEVNVVVRSAASSIFLTTAVCQSGRLDMLVVLSVQTKLIWKIAHIYFIFIKSSILRTAKSAEIQTPSTN
jgi:hypothetical protein